MSAHLAAMLADSASDTDRLQTMFRLFLLAALLITPFAAITIRRILVGRHERSGSDPEGVTTGGSEGGSGGIGGSASGSPASPDDLARVIAEIDAAARRLDDESIDEVVVVLPSAPTLDGRPADGAVAASLIADAAARSGMSVRRDDSTDPSELRFRRPAG